MTVLLMDRKFEGIVLEGILLVGKEYGNQLDLSINEIFDNFQVSHLINY